MGFDAFIKIDGIPGESTDDKHKDQIEITSFSLGVTQAATDSMSTGGAQSGGRADIEDFKFAHQFDKATPILYRACANGEHIKSMVIELCRATGEKQKFMEYKLSDCMITGVAPSGSSGDSLPAEEVTVRFAKIELTYTETDNKTGKKKGDIKAGWDRSANKKV